MQVYCWLSIFILLTSLYCEFLDTFLDQIAIWGNVISFRENSNDQNTDRIQLKSLMQYLSLFVTNHLNHD